MNERSETVAKIIDNLRRVFQVVNEQSKKAEHATGLTGPQLWAIKTIAQDAPIMVSKLARCIYLHPTTMIGILDRLEKQGLVIRKRSSEDHRVVNVKLTRKGQALVNKAPEVTHDLLVAGLEKMNAKNLVNIAQVLDQMAGILGAQNIPSQLILSAEINIPGKTEARTIWEKSNIRRRSAITKP